MKYAFVLILVGYNTMGAWAQQNYVFADIGITPGFSVTGSHKLTRRFGAGVGLQGYSFYPTETNPRQFVPALFADLRLNSIQRKKHSFFYFLDIGIDFYKHKNTNAMHSTYIDNVVSDNGTLVDLGLGYFRAITKSGSGLYVSFKLISNAYVLNSYNTVPPNSAKYISFYGSSALSVGFRF